MERQGAIYDTEMEILCMECDMLINHLNSNYMMESTEANQESVIQRITEKVKEMVDKVVDFFTEFINSEKFKKKNQEIDDALKKNPSLKKKKFKIIDFDKYAKQKMKYLEDIDKAKNEEEIERIKKRRKEEVKEQFVDIGMLVIKVKAAFELVKWAKRIILNKKYRDGAVKTGLIVLKVKERQLVITEMFKMSRALTKGFGDAVMNLFVK